MRRAILTYVLLAPLWGVGVGCEATPTVHEVTARTEAGRSPHRPIRHFPNVLAVRPSADGPGKGALTTGDAGALDRESGALLTGAAPIVWGRTPVAFGKKERVPTFLAGTTPAFLRVCDWETLENGFCFTDLDVARGAKVCVLGQTPARELFGEGNPVGQEVRLGVRPFRVVGVLSRKGVSEAGIDQDDILLAPWTAIKTTAGSPVPKPPAEPRKDARDQVRTTSKLYPQEPTSLYPDPSKEVRPPGIATVDQILVGVSSASKVPEAIQQVTGLLRERHRIKPGQPDDFRIQEVSTGMEKPDTGASTPR